PLDQVYNLKHAGAHIYLMEHLETLKVVSAIIERGALPARVQVPAEPDLTGPMASEARVRKFLADVATGDADLEDPRATDPKIWRRFVMETSLC
ncbi:MAG: hypothetical protein ACRDGN_10840, partial [bacterium]